MCAYINRSASAVKIKEGRFYLMAEPQVIQMTQWARAEVLDETKIIVTNDVILMIENERT